MKKNYTTIFIILFSVWLITLSYEGALPMASSKVETLPNEFCGVAKVTDGDTIKIDEKKIRLLYIDAPESSQTCFDKNYDEYFCGKISKEFLQNLIAEKQVKCLYDKFDKYGRYLAECFIDNNSINNELVKNGMAVTYFFGHINQEIANSEIDAKENHRGIWQGAFQLPKDYRKTHSFKHKVK